MSKRIEDKREIPVTKNYFRLKAADAEGKFYKVLEGSSGSGKTFSIEQYLIEKALAEKRRIRAMRYDQSTCRDSIIADFKRVMQEQFQIWEDKRWNGTNFEYTFENGSYIHFRGASDAQKIHGPRYDITWANEVMELPYDSHVQIAMRTAEEIIYDFNPSVNQHWIFEKLAGRDDCAWIHSTFLDNPMLPDTARDEILKLDPDNPENIRQNTANKWKWEVYGLGKRGQREGAIYTISEILDFWPDPNLCEKWGFGLDFGYSKDPCALVECAIFQGKLCLREWFYETGLTTIKSHMNSRGDSIQGYLEMMNFDRNWKIVADGARPDLVEELNREGYNVYGSKKGKGSVIYGIDIVSRFPICIHRNSNNLQMEVQQYAWAKKPNGEARNEPEDRFNHALDAVRYWVMDECPGFVPGGSGFKVGKTAVAGRRRKRY